MARPRSLPPGIRPRGKGYVYDWRDATGKTFSRKAGDTVDEAIAFKAKIDAELATGTRRSPPSSGTSTCSRTSRSATPRGSPSPSAGTRSSGSLR